MADEVRKRTAGSSSALRNPGAPPGCARCVSVHVSRQLDTIESASIIDWSKDCGPRRVKPRRTGRDSCIASGPESLEPHGRVHFCGAFCDNLNSGQEAAARSADRVAAAIHPRVERNLPVAGVFNAVASRGGGLPSRCSRTCVTAGCADRHARLSVSVRSINRH